MDKKKQEVEKRHDFLIVPRFSGPVPPDAVVTKCSSCGADGLCRPGLEKQAKRDAFMRGRKLLVLCDVCAEKPIESELHMSDIEVHGQGDDVLSAVGWMNKRRRNASQSN